MFLVGSFVSVVPNQLFTLFLIQLSHKKILSFCLFLLFSFIWVFFISINRKALQQDSQEQIQDHPIAQEDPRKQKQNRDGPSNATPECIIKIRKPVFQSEQLKNRLESLMESVVVHARHTRCITIILVKLELVSEDLHAEECVDEEEEEHKHEEVDKGGNGIHKHAQNNLHRLHCSQKSSYS